MCEDEKPINIKIQNNNCLIYLKNNELNLLDQIKINKKEESLYEDDIKEMSYSVSNISENYSTKRKINRKKNINISKEKIDFEISDISIFNTNLKPENSSIKTPLFEKNKKEENTNKKTSKIKEKNQIYFDDVLKSKKLTIKKLNFDSAECDTLQETDTIKRIYTNKKKDENANNIENENINKNLHNQFISNSLLHLIHLDNNQNDIIKQPKKVSYKNNIFKKAFKKNNKNIINIKNELMSTINYKLECIEKYHNQLNETKSKNLIKNYKTDFKCRSFFKEKIESKIIYNTTNDFYNNKNIKLNNIKYNNDPIKKIYNKNIIKRNFSYNKKKIKFDKSFISINSKNVLNNQIKFDNMFNLHQILSYNLDIKNKRNVYRKKSLDIKNSKINNKLYEKKLFLNNNNKRKSVCSFIPSNNILNKKYFCS